MAAPMPLQDWVLYAVYLSFFAFWGVAVRLYLAALFLSPHGSGADVTSDDSALFTALPPNILGCFLIGLALPGATLGLSAVPVAALSSDSVFQSNPYLLVGFRTGFCGSLTTFSSWNLAMVQLLCARRHWVSGLFGYYVGFSAAYVAMVVGMVVATALHNRHARQLPPPALPLPPPLPPTQAPRPTSQSASSALKTQLLAAATQPPGEEGEEDPVLRYSEQVASHHYSFRRSSTKSIALRPSAARSGKLQAIEESQRESAEVEDEEDKAEQRRIQRALQVANGCVVVATVVIAVALVVAVVRDNSSRDSNIAGRQIWLAILLAPPGACLRWYLGREYNTYISRGYYSFFPLGTWLANVLASVIDGIMAGVLVVHDPYWLDVVFTALQNGTMGSLSTVSTFFTELYALWMKRGDEEQVPVKMMIYLFGTLVPACVLTVLAFVFFL